MLFTLARKYIRVCGPLCDPMGSRHEAPDQYGNLLRFLSALSFWIAIANWLAARSTINLPSNKSGSPYRRKVFLLCKNPCGRAAVGDGGPHGRGRRPRAKKFPEEICFAPSRVSQVCRTPDYRAFKSTQARSTGTTVRTGQPGVPEGPLPLCFRKSPEKTLLKGFLWATSS